MYWYGSPTCFQTRVNCEYLPFMKFLEFETNLVPFPSKKLLLCNYLKVTYNDKHFVKKNALKLNEKRKC